MKTLSPKFKVQVPSHLPNFYRPTWVEINHSHLKQNLSQLRKLVSSKVKILAVVKANAYGHGLVSVSKTLSNLQNLFLGVTSLEEAIQLQEAKIQSPILILGNIFPFSNLEEAIRRRIRLTVASREAALMCDRMARKLNQKVYCHAKIDTGMNRIGVRAQNSLEFIQRILEYPTLKLEGIYTHFADSAEDPEFTRFQWKLFSNLNSQLEDYKISVPYLHCANSSALLKYPNMHLSMVRPGISLYGVNPAQRTRSANLKPVLSWKSRIIFLKVAPARTPVSYAGTFVTRRRSKIATAAFGYADGFRRSLSNRGEVLVRGKRVPIIGRVTMDMTMLDVTDLPEVRVGDEVVIVGNQGEEEIQIQELAQKCQTSPYEIFCGISTRVPRVDIP